MNSSNNEAANRTCHNNRNLPRKPSAVWLLLAICFALVLSIAAQFSLLTNPYAINDDARSIYRNIYPLDQDNQRPVDIYAEQMMFRQKSIIITGLSWLAANAIPFVPMTKWFPVLLMLFTSWIAFQLLFRITDSGLSAFLFTVLLICYGWSGWTPFYRCGLAPSDFLILYYLLFLYGVATRRPWVTAVTLFAALDMYAPAFVQLSLVTGILIVWGFFQKSFDKRFLKILTLAVFVSCFIFLFKHVFTSELGSHSLAAYEQMILMPEFYEGGRTPMFFPGDWWSRLSNPRSGLAIGATWLAIFFAMVALLILSGKKFLSKTPIEIYSFFFGSFLLFIASNILLFRLFSPSRYVRFSIPLFIICISAIAFSQILGQKKWRQVTGAFLVLAAIVFTFIQKQPHQEALDEPSLAHFLTTLPNDIVIAATPELSDTLNVFADRNGYLSAEMTLPYFPQFYFPIKQRVQQFFGDYYGRDLSGMRSLCQAGDVTHLVMNEEDFLPPEDPDEALFYQPFDDMLRELRKDKQGVWLPPESFAVYRLPSEKALFQVGTTRVYSCKEITIHSYHLE